MERQATCLHLFLGALVSLLYMLFYFYDYLLQTSFSVLPQTMQIQYGITTESFGFLSAAFFYGYVIFQLPLGYCLDRIGLKYTAILCAACCALGSALLYFSPNFEALFFSRFLIGAGTACACVMSVYAVLAWLPKEYFSVGVGAVQVAACLGSIFGQAVSAWVTHRFGWHISMLGMIYFGLILFLIYLFLPKQSFYQNKAAADLVRLRELPRLLLNKQVIVIALLGFIAWAPVSVLAASWMVRLLDHTQGFTSHESARWVISFWVGLAVASILIGKLSDKLQSRQRIVFIALAIQLICGIVLAATITFSPMLLLLILFLLGAAASVQTLSFVLTAESVDKKVYGTAAALVNMVAAASGGVMNPIFGMIVSKTGSYDAGLWLFPVLSIIGLFVTQMALRETFGECDMLLSDHRVSTV